MAVFPVGLGPTPDQPGPGKMSGDQSFREPPRVRGERGALSGVDWEHDEKYFTPKPVKKRTYGDIGPQPLMDEEADIPQPIEKRISVKSRGPGTFYDVNMEPIPLDRFVSVLVSPAILIAIKNGELERGPDPQQAGRPVTPTRPAPTPPRRPPPPRPPAE